MRLPLKLIAHRTTGPSHSFKGPRGCTRGFHGPSSSRYPPGSRGLFSRGKAGPPVKRETATSPRGSILYSAPCHPYKFGANGGADMAAAPTYFTVLSIFPALL